jgi:hypothetical protein
MRAFFLFAGIVTMACLSAPGSARASTFCVAGAAMPPQCLYEDVRGCVKAAAPPNTFCTINPEVGLIYYGSQRYCTVQSDRLAQCMFVDRSQCNQEAYRNGAICIDREEIKDDLNPFRYDQRIQN